MTRFVELGPDGTLTAMAQACLADDGADSVFVPALRKDRDELTALLTAVSRLHVNGHRPDWSAVLPGAHRVDLPTYAFRRDRLWLERTYRADGSAAAAAEGAHHYGVTWQPVAGLPDEAALNGRWLIVAPEGARGGDGWDGALTAALASRGAEVVDVSCVPALDRAALADRLVSAVGDGHISGVVSALALDPGEREGTPVGVLATTLLLQALGDAGITAPLWTVTRGAVAVDGDDAPPLLDQAAVWGLGRVAALEHPDRWGGLIDIPDEVDQRAGARLALVLSGSCNREDQVAVRARGVLVRRLVPRRVRSANDSWSEWTPRGTLLITGGTGALGARVARWAVERGAEHVVLASRRGAGAPGAADLEAELTAAGARVTTVACDTTDRAAVRHLLETHPVDAVVHTAGVLDDGVLDTLTPERFDTVVRAKAAAALHLDELTRELCPDLSAFVLFSSLAGTVGSAGQANYAAANAMLDALAERRRALGLPGTSIAWGPWAGGGMASDTGAENRQRGGGVNPLDPTTALAALGACVAGTESVPFVADIDWDRFGPAFTAIRTSPLLDEVYEAEITATDRRTPTTPLRERLSKLSAEDRRRELLQTVRARTAAALGHRDVGAVAVDVAFRELGVDSLIAVELRNVLGAECGVSLPAAVVFDCPTPVALADFLYGEMFGVVGEEASAGLVAGTVVSEDPVVIVGMGCRFPGGVDSPEGLWRLLSEGGDG
ncbi:beta-ketoacyl reductase, partial [Streptomyces sporangiiformans]